MGNMDISTDVSNAKNFVFQKQAEIINQIKETLNAVSEAKNNAISARTALDQTNPLKIFTRHKLKKQRDLAERQLLYANSDAIISIFKILAYILELILFCFLIPMGLIQQQFKWVSEGFTQRDENFNHLVGAVGQIAEHVGRNSNRGSSGGSTSKGFKRLFIVLIIWTGIILGIFFALNSSKNNKSKETPAKEIVNEEKVPVLPVREEIIETQNLFSEVLEDKNPQKTIVQEYDVNYDPLITTDIYKQNIQKYLSQYEAFLEVEKKSLPEKYTKISTKESLDNELRIINPSVFDVNYDMSGNDVFYDETEWFIQREAIHYDFDIYNKLKKKD